MDYTEKTGPTNWNMEYYGKRARGRPRATWLKNIEFTGKKRNKSLRELNQLLTDQEKWKHFTKKDPTPQGT